MVWSSMICFSCAVCMITNFILPPGNMEKIVRMVLGLFIIVSIISPFSDSNLKIKLKVDLPQKNESNLKSFVKKLDKQFETLAEKNLKNIIEGILDDIDIKSKKIEIFMDTDQDSCISISKCKIFLSRSCKKSDKAYTLSNSEVIKIKDEVEKNLNINVEVLILD